MPGKNIEISLSEFEVEFSENNSTSLVRFKQRYESQNYLEDSRKEMVLRKQASQWYIVSEREFAE